MKTKMTTLLAAAMLLAGTTFAAGTGDPSQQVQNEFKRMFPNTTEAEWKSVSDYYQVRFIQDGQYLMAYYNTFGELESISRNISTAMLPLLLQKSLRDKLSGSWVSESIELSRNGGTEYYVTVENANDKTVYYANHADWSVYKRVQK